MSILSRLEDLERGQVDPKNLASLLHRFHVYGELPAHPLLARRVQELAADIRETASRMDLSVPRGPDESGTDDWGA